MTIIQKISIILGIALAVVGGAAGFDARYGKAGDVKQNKQAIKRIDSERLIEWLQSRLWALEAEHGEQQAQRRRDYKEIQAKIKEITDKMGVP